MSLWCGKAKAKCVAGANESGVGKGAGMGKWPGAGKGGAGRRSKAFRLDETENEESLLEASTAEWAAESPATPKASSPPKLRLVDLGGKTELRLDDADGADDAEESQASSVGELNVATLKTPAPLTKAERVQQLKDQVRRKARLELEEKMRELGLEEADMSELSLRVDTEEEVGRKRPNPIPLHCPLSPKTPKTQDSASHFGNTQSFSPSGEEGGEEGGSGDGGDEGPANETVTDDAGWVPAEESILTGQDMGKDRRMSLSVFDSTVAFAESIGLRGGPYSVSSPLTNEEDAGRAKVDDDVSTTPSTKRKALLKPPPQPQPKEQYSVEVLEDMTQDLQLTDKAATKANLSTITENSNSSGASSQTAQGSSTESSASAAPVSGASLTGQKGSSTGPSPPPTETPPAPEKEDSKGPPTDLEPSPPAEPLAPASGTEGKSVEESFVEPVKTLFAGGLLQTAPPTPPQPGDYLRADAPGGSRGARGGRGYGRAGYGRGYGRGGRGSVAAQKAYEGKPVCICLRPFGLVTCMDCGLGWVGRKSLPCLAHPGQIDLSGQRVCKSRTCQSANIHENYSESVVKQHAQTKPNPQPH